MGSVRRRSMVLTGTHSAIYEEQQSRRRVGDRQRLQSIAGAGRRANASGRWSRSVVRITARAPKPSPAARQPQRARRAVRSPARPIASDSQMARSRDHGFVAVSTPYGRDQLRNVRGDAPQRVCGISLCLSARSQNLEDAQRGRQRQPARQWPARRSARSQLRAARTRAT